MSTHSTDDVKFLGVTRSTRAATQVGIAALGALVICYGLVGLATIPSMPASESGFAEGLALLVFGLYVLAGFVVLAVGLLIPPGEAGGVRFSARQRCLLVYGAVAPIASVLVVPVGAAIAPPLPGPVQMGLVTALAGFVVSGPLATLVAVGSKLRDRLG